MSSALCTFQFRHRPVDCNVSWYQDKCPSDSERRYLEIRIGSSQGGVIQMQIQTFIQLQIHDAQKQIHHEINKEISLDSVQILICLKTNFHQNYLKLKIKQYHP